ncbi:MAG: ribosomal protein S18-alanine N-acetyltransferase [Anaerovoracaceae bacterium]|jgi:ribosomal-protein-alanine N-acetyltransferase
MMHDTLTLRRAGPADVDTLAAMDKRCFHAPWSRESFRQEMQHDELAYYIIGELGGRAVGYAGLWIIADEGHINNVGVLPEYRRRGIAAEILERLFADARRLGAHDFTLEVRVSNTEAIRLYRRFGFEPEGVRPGYYEDDHEDALIMWRRERPGEAAPQPPGGTRENADEEDEAEKAGRHGDGRSGDGHSRDGRRGDGRGEDGGEKRNRR